MRRSLAFITGAVALSGPAIVPSSAHGQGAPGTHVTGVDTVRPDPHKVVRKTFTPWARPNPRKVRLIIRLEAHRWNISPSSLSRRVACESHYKWYAGNGSYQGLLQFAPGTFHRGLSSIRSRQVKVVRARERMVPVQKVVHYSDGSVERKPGIERRQKVVTVYHGTLPRNPAVTHAWTQLRIGSQAIRGLSAVGSSEWSCPA